jgi:hypothetical protein
MRGHGPSWVRHDTGSRRARRSALAHLRRFAHGKMEHRSRNCTAEDAVLTRAARIIKSVNRVGAPKENDVYAGSEDR